MKGHRDLTAATAGAALCALLALLLPVEALRVVFAVPLTLVLPGYAISAAALGARGAKWEQTAVLSVGLSLAALALGSLALNYAPGGIRSGTWALLLVLVVAGGCRIAASRRATAAQRPAGGSLRWHSAGRALSWLSPPAAALFVGGLLAAVAALVLAFSTLPAKNALGYTALWLSPGSDGPAGTLGIAVSSNEQDTVSYLLRVRLGQGLPVVRRRFSLTPGETHVARLDIPRTRSRAPLPVSAALFRNDQPGKAYRRVTGWAPAKGARP